MDWWSPEYNHYLRASFTNASEVCVTKPSAKGLDTSSTHAGNKDAAIRPHICFVLDPKLGEGVLIPQTPDRTAAPLGL